MSDTKQLMNDEQAALYETAGALLALSLIYPMILAAVAALAAAFLQLATEKDGISSVAVTRDEKKSSIKNVKVSSRASLAVYTFKYSRKLRALGKSLNIAELKNLASLPVSIAKKMRFENMSEYATEILQYLKKYLEQLSDQKVTQLDVDQFEAMTLEYSTALSTTDATHSQTVSETQDLDERFTRFMDKIQLLDDIVDGLRTDYPDFCRDYDAARKVYRYGLRHRTPEELEALQAKAEANKLKRTLARKEKVQKAKAAKIQKLQQEKAEAEKFIAEHQENNPPARPEMN